MWEMSKLGEAGPPGCTSPLPRVHESAGSCLPQVGLWGEMVLLDGVAVLAKPSLVAVKLGNVRCTFTEAGASDFLEEATFLVTLAAGTNSKWGKLLWKPDVLCELSGGAAPF